MSINILMAVNFLSNNEVISSFNLIKAKLVDLLCNFLTFFKTTFQIFWKIVIIRK